MAGRTPRYGWNTLQQGESLSDDGYKYTFSDRLDMDQKMWLAAEGHHHKGGLQNQVPVPIAPTLTRNPTGGLIPAGTRVYYKISLVGPDGTEGAASVESFIDTPAPVASPAGPTLTFASTGGALLGGDYYYALSAYTGNSTTETRAAGTAFISVNSTTGLNRVTVTFPTLPSGATGFNIYRRAPGEGRYFFLTNINMVGGTPPTTFIDTGAIAENCDRTIPQTNTTNSANSITVGYPITIVPTGHTWKIYRTYLNGVYTRSLLHWVVEYTAEATPVVRNSWIDIGIATTTGAPLATVPSMTNPSKIDLSNAAEVQGTLPMGSVSGFPLEVTFDFAGDTTGAVTGLPTWVCEFPTATIISCRAHLGRGLTPSGTVTVDVLRGPSSATPVFTTIYTTVGNRPKVLSGQTRGARATPDVKTLAVGDLLAVDVISVAGATPLARYLTVTIYMVAEGYPLTSHTPGSTTGT